MSGTPAAPGLCVTGLYKRFGAVESLRDVEFAAAPGEIVAICGPSGAGKSTLARLISGLEHADDGDIALAGRRLTGTPPQRRRVAHMFESYALYPTLDVFDNIASPLRAPAQRGRIAPSEIAARVGEVMALTEIAALRARRPAELSGGQKQRVALCRTLVQSPDLYLLDEPIGHLDAKLRHKLRGEIRRRLRATQQPVLWFTPDAVEAMAVADRVVMLIGGRVRQIGTPAQIYLQPADVTVARLVGDPAMNLLPIAVEEGPAGICAAHAGGSFRMSSLLAERLMRARLQRAVVGFAPVDSDLRPLAADDSLLPDEIAGEVYSVDSFGKFTVVTVEVGGARLRCKFTAAVRTAVGERVAVRLPTRGVTLFDGKGVRDRAANQELAANQDLVATRDRAANQRN